MDAASNNRAEDAMKTRGEITHYRGYEIRDAGGNRAYAEIRGRVWIARINAIKAEIDRVLSSHGGDRGVAHRGY